MQPRAINVGLPGNPDIADPSCLGEPDIPRQLKAQTPSCGPAGML
jgi:hypothetical protein